jgi:hypothetical protein
MSGAETITLLAVALFLTWAVYLLDEDWLRLRLEPLAGVRDFALDAAPFFAVTMAFVVFVIVAAVFPAFVKMPQANRTIFYEIDGEAILHPRCGRFRADDPLEVGSGRAGNQATPFPPPILRRVALHPVAGLRAPGPGAAEGLGDKSGRPIGLRRDP